MTGYQLIANEYLGRFKEAKIKLDQLDKQVEYLTVRAENLNSAKYGDSGWTGNTYTDKRGKAHKEMRPIRKSSSTNSGNKIQEMKLADLADKSIERDKQASYCYELYKEIEKTVESLIEDQVKCSILILYHLSDMTYKETAPAVRYSPSHTRRKHCEALEEFGEKAASLVKSQKITSQERK